MGPLRAGNLGADVTDTVLIIDFGSQVTQLIARRVREAGVYSEIVPFNQAEAAMTRLNPKALVLSGGPASVTAEGSPRAPQSVFDSGLPILSICYGQQTTAVQLGGIVEGGHAAEFGRAEVDIKEASALFDGVWQVGKRYPVWMSHGDRVTRLPDGFTVKATSENAPFAVASDERRRIYTTMFHPEVVHTPDGAKLLSNFVHKIAGLKNDWTMAHFRTAEVAKIRALVGRARVISGLSGGVDSAVASVLIHEAIGDQLTCIFVDHGLMRQNEAEEVVRLFRGHYNIPLIHVDARERFLAALAGKSDPEAKRKTIGALFIEVFRRGGRQARRRRFPRAGHALSRRDRERVVHRRPVGDHQVAPQRRRLAGAHEPQARRAACANCSRTRCARWAASWGCPSTLSGGIRSPALVLPSAFPAR